MSTNDCQHEDVEVTVRMPADIIFSASATGTPDSGAVNVHDVADAPADVDIENDATTRALGPAVCQDCGRQLQWPTVRGIPEVPQLWPQICDRILRGSDYEVVEADDEAEPDAWEMLEQIQESRNGMVFVHASRPGAWMVSHLNMPTISKLGSGSTRDEAIRDAWNHVHQQEDA